MSFYRNFQENEEFPDRNRDDETSNDTTPTNPQVEVKRKRKRKTKLKRKSSTAVGAYTCIQCKKTFTRLDNLNVHKKNFHLEAILNACFEGTHAGEKRFCCDQCER